MKTRSVLLAAACGLLAFAVSVADEGDKAKKKRKKAGKQQPNAAKLFERFDKNNDGVLEQSEVPERLGQRLSRLDKNKDGKLTKDEFGGARPGADRRRPDAPPPGGPDVLFRMLDENRDGKLSKGELDNAGRLMSQLDKNDDGLIDREELGGPSDRRRPGRQAPFGDSAPGGVLFEQLDADKDGKISKDEARGPFKNAFDRIDQDGDGSLNQEELGRATARFARDTDRARPTDRAGGRRPRPIFDDFDKDVDGRLTPEELNDTRFKGRFKDLDADKDGKLTPAEFEKLSRSPEK